MRFRTIAAAFAALVVIAVGIPVGINALQEDAHDRREAQREARAELRSAGGGRANRVSDHRKTGLVRFIGTEHGHPIKTAGDTPVAAARAFLGEFGAAFGVHDAAAQLRLDRAEIISTRRAMNAGAVVRFQQKVSEVPVVAGELTVRLDEANNVVSALGEILPTETFDGEPSLRSADAAEIARRAVAKREGVRRRGLSAEQPKLWIYSPALIGAPAGPGGLVWRTTVTSLDPITKVQVLVDAHAGNVALYVDELQHARDRRVCNNNNNPNASFECTSPVRTENGSATGIAEVDAAHDYTGDAYDFFLDHHDRDSIDDDGMPIKSVVKYCDLFTGCPMVNAFWFADQLTFGEGFVADDVVVHELTHGVIEKTAGLFYAYQSGAINESFADVWGELVDVGNGSGNDTASVRWLLGEDVNPPGTEFDGAARDMENPPALGQPDRMRSPLFYDEEDDNGGVHYNSGVNNKAAFLLTDGGTFNGQTVSALGIAKVADIYYEALTNALTSGSDYADLFDALQQACDTLIGTGGITASNCGEVTKAVTATEMNLQPVSGGAPEAPLCDTGDMTTIFFDDVESGTSGWQSSPSGAWQQGDVFAHSGRSAWLTVTDAVDSAVALTMTGQRSIPAGSDAYLRFDHAYFFEHLGDFNFDGGIVEYTVNNGGTWTDIKDLPDVNGYNGTILDGSNNPLDGQPAFVGHSRGYTSTRVNLSSLAGQQIRFRFRYGTDETVNDYGWAIDDVRIYTCSQPTQPSLSIGDATVTEGDSGTKTATFTVTKSATSAQTSTVSYATANGSATAGSDYVAKSGTLTFTGTDLSETVAVTINGDTTVEPDETFEVRLSAASNATIGDGTGAGTISNDDTEPTKRTVSVTDAGDEEGDALRFTLAASNPQLGDVTVNIATENGSAAAPGDYTAVSTSVTIPGGSASVPVDVLTTEDSSAEPTESFKLNLSGVSANGSIGDVQAIGTITDDDARMLSVGDTTVSEGGDAVFTVSATDPTRGAVSFHVETVAGSATSADFTPLAATQETIESGQSSIQVTVPTTDDVDDEPNETFKLRLSNPSERGVIGAADGTATINDNDVTPVKRELRIGNRSVDEGENAVFTVTASNPGAGDVTVHVATSAVSAEASDFDAVSRDVTIGDADNAVTVTVPTKQDADTADETFNITLSAPSSNAVIIDADGRGTIVDDDEPDDDDSDGDDDDDSDGDDDDDSDGDDDDPTPSPSVTPTPAGTTGAALKYSPGTLVAAKTATVSGSGFPANTLIDVYIQSEPMFLGSVRTTAAGTFTLVVDIPLLAPGSHTFVARRATDDASLATAPATVAQVGTTATQAPGATPAPTARVLAADETPVPASSLPDTGASIGTIVMYALLAIALGLSSVGAERWVRRRRTG